MAYSDYYGTLAQYFGQAGGTNSPGKGGGPGYNNDLGYYAAPNSTQGDSQQASASSGSGWISAAASTDSTDKSNFSTPFQQGFGGITNYNVTASPGVGISGGSPITAPPVVNAVPALGQGLVAGGVNVMTILLVLAALLAAKLVLKG